MSSLFKSPVYPLLAFYNDQQELDLDKVGLYLEYLVGEGAKAFCSTVGTSDFALLDHKEKIKFNNFINKELNSLDESLPFIMAIPPLNLMDSLLFTKECHTKNPNRYLMGIYPDRFYTGEEVVDYFHTLADHSSLPIFIHGIHIRDAIRGGYRDWDSELVNRVAENPGVVGLKEECSTVEKAQSLCSGLDKPLNVVVAGGSCKRFLATKAFGSTNFLTGLGSIIPWFDNLFFKTIQESGDNRYDTLEDFIKKEDELFEITKLEGWHCSLREAICYKLGVPYFMRKPFHKLSEGTYSKLTKFIDENS